MVFSSLFLVFTLLLVTLSLPGAFLALEGRQSITDPSISTSDTNNRRPKQQQQIAKDDRWPNEQLNVLVDSRSINKTEQQILAALFEQLEHKTCIKIVKLPADSMNPFTDSENLPESERNFVYIFKSQYGAYNRNPSIGLSSFGCVHQGRQSLVLTDLAFRWPEIVLRYHILRTLGIPDNERPDKQIRKLLQRLPMSQKISYDDEKAATSDNSGSSSSADPGRQFNPESTYIAYATLAGLAASSPAARTSGAASNDTLQQHQRQQGVAAPDQLGSENTRQQQQQLNAKQVKSVEYLKEEDLNKIKNVYECKGFQNRLSLKPINGPELVLPQSSSAASVVASDNLASQEQQASQEQKGIQVPSSPAIFYSPASPTALINELPAPSTLDTQLKLEQAEDSIKEILKEGAENGDKKDRKIDSAVIDDAAKSIVNYLLSETQDLQKAATEVYADSSNSTTISQQELGNIVGDLTTQPSVDSLFQQQQQEQNEGGANSCRPLQSCPIPGAPQERTPAANDGGGETHANGKFLGQERPMMLKLDKYHAQDPQLQQANQIKLSQVNDDNLATYRLMNSPDSWTAQQQQQYQELLLQQQQQQPGSSSSSSSQQQFGYNQLPTTTITTNGGPKSSEMLISFEQIGPQQSNNPLAALATSQVLKICSCTCQTMTPANSSSGGGSSPPVTQSPTYPTYSTYPTYPTYPTYTTYPTYPSYQTHPTYPATTPVTSPPPTTTRRPPPPTTEWPQTPDWTETQQPSLPAWTEEPAYTPTPTKNDSQQWSTITTMPTTATTFTSTQKPTTATPTTTTQEPPQSGSGICEQVQWVRPNKTVYASAKIVWDVDRANQNYFLCNNMINGELVPGKTHGFSCKVSSEGKAYELHDFSVLTKPENLSLAWVKRDSDAFGKKYVPVMGGFSKAQDPYIVSRCLVRDENNDIITLIGYINNKGVGWFPFDDIQIECAEYDVLSCVAG